MQKCLNQIFLTIVMTFLSSCSFYKSEGRKSFETQAPTQVRTLSFVGCQDQMPALTTYEVFQTPRGTSVYAVQENEEVLVYTSFNEENQKRVCTYSAPNQSYWLDSKDLFLSELDSLTSN